MKHPFLFSFLKAFAINMAQLQNCTILWRFINSNFEKSSWRKMVTRESTSCHCLRWSGSCNQNSYTMFVNTVIHVLSVWNPFYEFWINATWYIFSVISKWTSIFFCLTHIKKIFKFYQTTLRLPDKKLCTICVYTKYFIKVLPTKYHQSIESGSGKSS